MPRLDIQLRTSKKFVLFYGLIILMSLMIVFYLPFLLMIKLVLASAVLIYGFMIFYKVNLLRAIHYGPEGWRVRLREKNHDVIWRGDSTLTAWVSVLRFTLPEKRRVYSYLILKDAMSAEEYRRLLVTVRSARQ